MSNERSTMVLAEASLPSGLTATLMAGHVVVFSMQETGKASSHFGIAQWKDGRFVHLQFASTYCDGGWHDGGPSRADFTAEIQSDLAAALSKAITKPWRVFNARLTKDRTHVRLTGLNLWTGGEFFWAVCEDSFDPKMYQSHLYDFTHCTFEPGARERLVEHRAPIESNKIPLVHDGVLSDRATEIVF